MSLTNKFLPVDVLALFFSLLSLLHIRSLAISLATTTSSLSLSSVVSPSNETDFHALLAIKSNILSESRHALRSWNESLHFCEWQGVKCSRRHERVTSIDLMSQDLVGSLSPHIGNLSFLRVLSLSNNTFLGEIPIELGNLFRLQMLYLTNNSFEGKIPVSMSHCSKLTILDVGNNMLVGEFPQQLCYSLRKLVSLAIYKNMLTGGVPPSLVNLTSLEKFFAASNPLGGSIPDSLGQLVNLRILGLSTTQISGIIPLSIYNLSLLSIFSVSLNQLEGTLPPGFGFMFPNLQQLDSFSNQFTGSFPLSLSNSSQMVWLDLGENNLSGKLKYDFGNQRDLMQFSVDGNNLGSGEIDELAFLDSLTNCSNLVVLGMSRNKFSGVLPDSIGNLSRNLFYFNLVSNQIYGTIPTTIGNLVGLTTLGMQYNRFTGKIPDTIGYLYKLQRLGFQYNNLSGEIPNYSIGNLSLMNELYLDKNSLEGAIPSSLGNCQNLLLLTLYGNNLTGSIPVELLTISSLSISLDLARNRLSGSLPAEVGNLKNLVNFDVSENRLSGEIPSTLGSCHSLENLFLQKNFFDGSIPNSLESLRGTQNIDFSNNNLSGQIPTFLGSFFLKNLNLSFNDFEGEVPRKGVFTNLSAISVAGNPRLCGGISELQLSHCINKRRKSKMLLSQKLAIAIPSSLVGVFLLSFSVIFWFKKKRIAKPGVDLFLKEPFLKVTYGELLKATNGFSSSNLLGFGRFGRVYSGILDRDCQFVVAVKVLSLQTRGAAKSFIAECEALKTIRHRNLVRIITCCSTVDFQGNDFKALVYEFMPNGSLENWLHPSPEASNGQNEFQGLNIVQRINISIDVASALNYLHHECQSPIIHCDLKPSNILLDRDMVAHVGDFGLAKFHTEIDTPTPNTSSSGVKGTIGYAAPEYGLGSKMSSHGDMYSYGILLLEMITGKRPTDISFEANGHNLHTFVRLGLPQRVMEIVDPLLLTNEEHEVEPNQLPNDHHNRMVEDALIPMLNIGLACSTDSPQHRLSISDVIHELYRVKNKILEGSF